MTGRLAPLLHERPGNNARRPILSLDHRTNHEPLIFEQFMTTPAYLFLAGEQLRRPEGHKIRQLSAVFTITS